MLYPAITRKITHFHSWPPSYSLSYFLFSKWRGPTPPLFFLLYSQGEPGRGSEPQTGKHNTIFKSQDVILSRKITLLSINSFRQKKKGSKFNASSRKQIAWVPVFHTFYITAFFLGRKNKHRPEVVSSSVLDVSILNYWFLCTVGKFPVCHSFCMAVVSMWQSSMQLHASVYLLLPLVIWKRQKEHRDKIIKSFT